MESIKGKNVLIAGATGSIGEAATRLLASTGANLFLTSTNKEKLQALGQSYKVDASHLFEMDMAKPESIRKIAPAILAQVPTLDILINATGIGIIKPFENLTYEDFANSLAINLTGPFALIQSFLPSMKEVKKGLIINIPGVLGKTPMAGAAAYAASKYGLNGMMKSLREELKRTDIRITQLFLGGVDSHFWDTIDMRVQREKMILAEEAGKAIWFLCQQPSSGVVSEMVIQPFNHQAI